MGAGSYSAADWSKLKRSAKLDSSASAEQIYVKREMDPKYDPQYIGVRESRDSEEHPNSTPIMIGLDVTGSMGYLAEEIAKNALHETMMKLYSTNCVQDPQLMFAAIGDVKDLAPLQVTQFESDIRIAEQLLDLWLEYRGGDLPEDYPLLWYFAAKHVDTDSMKKRQQKGFLFTIGDADAHESISAKEIKTIFNDEVSGDLSTRKLADLAGKSFELFHIAIMSRPNSSFKVLSRALPGRMIYVAKDEVSYLPEIIISVIQYTQGKEKKEILKQWNDLAKPIVKQVLSKLVVSGTKKGFFF